MAEPLLARNHPLQAWVEDLAAVGITVDPYVPMVDVRLAPDAPAGIARPAEPNTWVAADGGWAVWLGPDEWLLTGTTEARVRAAVVPLGGAATDVSAQRITLRLTGDRARDLLAKGCAIDLHPRVFRRGHSAQTTLAQAAVVLLALGDAGDDYLVLVRSSFAGHLAGWLLDAALEYAQGTPRSHPSHETGLR